MEQQWIWASMAQMVNYAVFIFLCLVYISLNRMNSNSIPVATMCFYFLLLLILWVFCTVSLEPSYPLPANSFQIHGHSFPPNVGSFFSHQGQSVLHIIFRCVTFLWIMVVLSWANLIENWTCLSQKLSIVHSLSLLELFLAWTCQLLCMWSQMLWSHGQLPFCVLEDTDSL